MNKQLSKNNRYLSFLKDFLFVISLLIVILSFTAIGFYMGTDYQKQFYEQPISENWLLLESIPEDLEINLTAHMTELNLTCVIPYTVEYSGNNSLLSLHFNYIVNSSVTYFRLVFSTSTTLMLFMIGEHTYFTYGFSTTFFSPYENESDLINLQCNMFYSLKFLRRID